MSTDINWTNPYADRDGSWLRGNLHTHTSPASACGSVPLARVLDLYALAGYDFLAISDHMTLTTPDDPRLIFLPGIEWNAPSGMEHTGIYALDPALVAAQCAVTDKAALLASLADADALTILNHPNWCGRPHYRREELAAAEHYDGIEIFNGVIQRLEGYEISTDKWDYLLADGRRVLGFASDDSHIESDIGAAWLAVRAAARTPRAVFTALRTGNFYCSSGTTITDIRREENLITVETADGQEIQVIGHGGRLLHRVREGCLTFDVANITDSYVRFTVFGAGSAMAWTQPFFLTA